MKGRRERLKKEEERNLRKRRASCSVQIILRTLILSYDRQGNPSGSYFFEIIQVYSDSIIFSFRVLGIFTQPLLYLHRTGKLTCIWG
jgi:hypothetical protein